MAITREKRKILYFISGGKCPSCNKQIQNKHRNLLDSYMTVDHIVPKSLGGTDNIDNLRPLCRDCNNKRGNAAIEDLLAYKDSTGHWFAVSY